MESFKVDGIGYPQQVIKAETPKKAARKFAESNNMLGELLNNGGERIYRSRVDVLSSVGIHDRSYRQKIKDYKNCGVVE